MRKEEFVNGEFYHIYNRGIEKREIFLDSHDFHRFMHYLYKSNNDGPTPRNIKRKINVQGEALHIDLGVTKRDPIVDIICYTLIPNHYHFMLQQLKEDGISKFMHKIGTGYAMYFNERYERTGSLFEGPFQARLVTSDEYLMHLSRYIHLNCLGLIEPGWKEEGIKNWDRANKFLESYKWSSYLDYVGKQNLAYIINKKSLQEYFKTQEDYKRYIQSWVVKDLDVIEGLLIE